MPMQTNILQVCIDDVRQQHSPMQATAGLLCYIVTARSKQLVTTAAMHNSHFKSLDKCLVLMTTELLHMMLLAAALV